MTRARRYQLLCPVARSLDALGDRWSLLILRDLHAGPARFQELQRGLGVATNLLSTRLDDLQRGGLIERADDSARAPYRLTELGRRTDRLIWELVRFGGLLERDPAPRRPGNLRTLALPLRMMLGPVAPARDLRARLVVDGEPFTISAQCGEVEVVYGELDPADPDTLIEVDVQIETSYLPLLDLAEGAIEPSTFVDRHVRVTHGHDRAAELAAWLGAGLATA